MGWTRKILRIDLTTGNVKSEPLNMDWALKYIGQRGLALCQFRVTKAFREFDTIRSGSHSLSPGFPSPDAQESTSSSVEGFNDFGFIRKSP